MEALFLEEMQRQNDNRHWKSNACKSGDGGIRTLVPAKTDKLISSQPRYGHFGTSPMECDKLCRVFYKKNCFLARGERKILFVIFP